MTFPSVPFRPSPLDTAPPESRSARIGEPTPATLPTAPPSRPAKPGTRHPDGGRRLFGEPPASRLHTSALTLTPAGGASRISYLCTRHPVGWRRPVAGGRAAAKRRRAAGRGVHVRATFQASVYLPVKRALGK